MVYLKPRGQNLAEKSAICHLTCWSAPRRAFVTGIRSASPNFSNVICRTASALPSKQGKGPSKTSDLKYSAPFSLITRLFGLPKTYVRDCCEWYHLIPEGPHLAESYYGRLDELPGLQPHTNKSSLCLSIVIGIIQPPLTHGRGSCVVGRAAALPIKAVSARAKGPAYILRFAAAECHAPLLAEDMFATLGMVQSFQSRDNVFRSATKWRKFHQRLTEM